MRARPSRRRKQSAEGLTRSEVARELGCSVATVRRLEASGELAATLVRGVHRFEPSAVAARVAASKPRKRDDGAKAARAWAMFRDGRGLVDVVTELEIDPAEARRLADELARAGVAGVVLPPDTVAALAAEGFGDLSGAVTAASILSAARSLRARARELRRQRAVA